MDILRRIRKRIKDFFEDIQYMFCSCDGHAQMNIRDKREYINYNHPYLTCAKCHRPKRPTYKKWWKDKHY